MKARDVMTPNPTICSADSSIIEAAQIMKDRHIGDVLVAETDGICGIVTDRDIVVRALATSAGANPQTITLGDICTHELHSVSEDTPVEEIIQMMKSHSLRRIPVMEGSSAKGIVSIGDLAIHRDRESALAKISSAPPTD
jgi:CBS domain-containing protein